MSMLKLSWILNLFILVGQLQAVTPKNSVRSTTIFPGWPFPVITDEPTDFHPPAVSIEELIIALRNISDKIPKDYDGEKPFNIMVWSHSSTTTNKPKTSPTPNLKVTQKPEYRRWPDLIRTTSTPEPDYTDLDIREEPDDTDSETSQEPDYHDSILITLPYDRYEKTQSPEQPDLSQSTTTDPYGEGIELSIPRLPNFRKWEDLYETTTTLKPKTHSKTTRPRRPGYPKRPRLSLTTHTPKIYIRKTIKNMSPFKPWFQKH